MTDALPAQELLEREQLVGRLTVAARALHERSGRLIEPVQFPADLTMQQMRALALVGRRPGMSLNALRQALGVSAPTTSGLVERLVEKGLVVRGEDESDRRVRPLRVTPAGAALLADLELRMQRMIELLVPELSTAELRALLTGYEVLLAAVERAIATR